MLYSIKFSKDCSYNKANTNINTFLSSSFFILKQFENGSGDKFKNGLLYIPNNLIEIFKSEIKNIVTKNKKNYKINTNFQIFSEIKSFKFYPSHYPPSSSDGDFFIKHPSFGDISVENCTIKLNNYFEEFEKIDLITHQDYYINQVFNFFNKIIGYEIKFFTKFSDCLDIDKRRRVVMKLLIHRNKWWFGRNIEITRTKSSNECDKFKSIDFGNPPLLRSRSSSTPTRKLNSINTESKNEELRIGCKWKYRSITKVVENTEKI